VEAVLAQRTLAQSQQPPAEHVHAELDQAVLIARERYARGDITREQFQTLIADLSGSD